jgi:hypothetical protein
VKPVEAARCIDEVQRNNRQDRGETDEPENHVERRYNR